MSLPIRNQNPKNFEEITCAMCGKKRHMRVTPSDYKKRGDRFCSNECKTAKARFDVERWRMQVEEKNRKQHGT